MDDDATPDVTPDATPGGPPAEMPTARAVPRQPQPDRQPPPQRLEPVQLGTDRLAPAGVPEPDGRPWWQLAIPAAVVVLLVIGGLVFAFGRGDGPDAAAPTTVPTTSGVDISDLSDPTDPADPARTTTEPSEAETTTTAATASTTSTVAPPAPGERVEVGGAGLRWTMLAPPEASGKTWTATLGNTTEVLQVTDVSGTTYDVDTAMADFAATYGGRLDGVRDSHLAGVPGRTASFTGTLDAEPVVGWLVGAQVGGQGVLVVTYRVAGDLEGLYPEFLPFPASVTTG